MAHKKTVGPSQALNFFGVELDPGSTSFILLNNTVNELVDASLAPRTKIMYNRIWEMFCGFCKSYLTVANSNLPVSITTLSLYLAHLHNKGLASSTISSYDSAVVFFSQIA